MHRGYRVRPARIMSDTSRVSVRHQPKRCNLRRYGLDMAAPLPASSIDPVPLASCVALAAPA